MSNPMFSPTAPLNTEADAVAAARASAVAIFIGVLYGVVGIVMMMTTGADQIRAAAEASAAQSGMPSMADATVQFALYGGIAFVVIQAILGWVQWAKPNIVIPIIFAILVAFGLVMAVLGLSKNGALPVEAQTPMWQVVLGLVVMAVELFLHIVGIRGAGKLDKIRKAGPVDAEEFL